MSNRPLACGQDLPPDFSSCPDSFAWEVCFAVPAAALVPSTIDLPSYPYSAYESDIRGQDTECALTGTIFNQQGTLTITSADASSVAFSLSGTNGQASIDGPPVLADGSYTAPRCP